MATENNFSDQSTDTHQYRVLWQHYWQHLWLGVAIWVSISLCFAALLVAADGKYLGGDGILILCFFLLFFICFTLPAALGGLLRQPALAWLSRRARSRGELVGGSLLLFEATVVVTALFWWAYVGRLDFDNFWTSLLVCFFASLPWLLATGWASWQMAAKLTIPTRHW